MTDPTPRIPYTKRHEDPPIGLTWEDADGDVIDFSGHSFSLAIGTPGRDAEHTKTDGFTGAATAPNVTLTWSANELDDLDVGTHRGQLTATVGGEDRGPFPLTVEVYAAIT
jgi:hypothetical protein